MDQKNKLKFCIKNKEKDWSDVLIQMRLLSIFCHHENIDRLHLVIPTRGHKECTPKRFIFGEHSGQMIS